MSAAPVMIKDPGHRIGESTSEAVRIVMAAKGGKKGKGKKKAKKKPHILVTQIRLVHGNLRKNACRNRNTPTGTMCGSVWRTETRTLAGRLVNVKCLGCREVKKITKLGEQLAREEEKQKRLRR